MQAEKPFTKVKLVRVERIERLPHQLRFFFLPLQQIRTMTHELHFGFIFLLKPTSSHGLLG